MDLEALESEDERAARRNTPGREALGAVAFVRRNLEFSGLADGHAEAAHVPAFDDLTDAGLKVKGFCPSSLVDQNFFPVSLTTPVAWTVAVAPWPMPPPVPAFTVRRIVPWQPGTASIAFGRSFALEQHE
eukprot:CAMPEP_0197421590 /NCGR_PEP_ID=MMETSP1170-20131217/9781_1 /TAXON_ID=54406 /ORGANISM="Sarcinochrysis sp, Strain CCMP770" /LENGTH=129 /DNA_ID=CAMNT_0042948845 /DNA_START=138 /DNA_END=525 /DNA_ORIENTATION=-